MRHLPSLFLVALLVGGCASKGPLPNAVYQELAGYRAASKHCLDESHITPKFYADSEGALDVLLSRFTFDRERLHADTVAAFAYNRANASSCKESEVEGHMVITRAQNIRNAVAESNSELAALTRAINSQPRQPICYWVAGVHLCN